MLPTGGRLFFAARLDDPALLAPLRELLARLGEAGLGGRRSTGAGAFTVDGSHAAPGFLAGDGDGGEGAAPRARLLLSLYLPTRDEVARGALGGMGGDAVLRGGWIGSGGPTGLRKRPVRMLVEGTVLAAAAGKVDGEARDVRPEGFAAHPVWRDGRALAISYGGGS
jgi:CRISPR type III-A-associated RAMP protein Csm4